MTDNKHTQTQLTPVTSLNARHVEAKGDLLKQLDRERRRRIAIGLALPTLMATTSLGIFMAAAVPTLTAVGVAFAVGLVGLGLSVAAGSNRVGRREMLFEQSITDLEDGSQQYRDRIGAVVEGELKRGASRLGDSPMDGVNGLQGRPPP